MFKRALTISLTLLALLFSAQAQRNFRGSFNSFNNDAMTLGSGYYRVTIQETATSSRDFLFDQSGDGTFSPKWAPGAPVSFATTATAFNGGGDGSYSATSGNYYTFVLEGVGGNAKMSIHETSNTPITLNRTGQEESGAKFDPSDFYVSSGVENNVNTIQLTLSDAVHDEDVYVRYTTDGFASSSFVLATGAGTSFSADIPNQAPGTTVEYYAFTTTYSGGSLNNADADVATMAFNGNGANGSYTTFDLGDSFHIQAQTAGGAGEEMISGSSGTLTAFENSDLEARIYSGNVFQGGPSEAADQTAFNLHYRVNGGAWNTEAGIFNNTSGNDKYWLSTIDLTSINDSLLQYYLEYTYNDAETTYVYANGAFSFVSGFESNAQANPYSFTVGSVAAAAPEPSTFGLMALSAGILLANRHKTRASVA